MAESQSHSIRRVIRLGRGLQIAQAAHHVHHLFLLRPTVTDDRLLDLKRRIFKNTNSGLLTCQQDHASAVRDGDSGRDVSIEKQFFNRNRIRLKRIQQLPHILIDLIQTAG